jgi:rhamnogalacturonyl hydrolase YesR
VLYKHLDKTNDAKTMLRIVLSINMGDLYRKMINDINEKACDFMIDVHDNNDEELNVYITNVCLQKHSELYHNLYSNCSETMDNAIDRIYQMALPSELRYKLAKSL